MGGATSDHWGLSLEFDPAELVELSRLAAESSRLLDEAERRAASLAVELAAGAQASSGAPARYTDDRDTPLAEYGSSIDQAEELAAALTLELAKRDDELELERAARQLAERLAERRGRECQRLENEVLWLTAELERVRRGFRESYSREVK